MTELGLLLAGIAGLALAGGATAAVLAVRRRRAAEREAAVTLRAADLDEDPIIAAMGLDTARARDRLR